MGIKNKVNSFQQAKAKLVYNNFVNRLNDMLIDDKWYSSAQILEQELKKHGVVPTQKLYYEYKMPDNLKNYQIDQNTLFLRCFPAIYENYLESFSSIKTKKNLLSDAATTAKSDLAKFFGFCICLGLSNMKNLKYVFEQTYNICMEHVLQMAETIRKLNPELQHIKDYKNLNFVNGAIYGFAPQEIEFFIQLSKNDTKTINETLITNKNMNKIENFIQKPIGYRLSKTTSENILKDIETTKIKTFQIYNQDIFIVE